MFASLLDTVSNNVKKNCLSLQLIKFGLLLNCTGAVTGLCSIWTLVFISYDRYNVIVNGVGGTPLSSGRAMLMMVFAWGYAIGWSIPPFFGWGKYIPEGRFMNIYY